MSVETKEVILVVLNLWVGLGYIALSICFAATFTVLGGTLGRRKLDLPRFVLPALWVGSALFLAGCGIHHFHLALEMIPESIGKFGKDSLWVSHFNHHTIIAIAQAIGAPVVITVGWLIMRAARRTTDPRGGGRTYSATSRKSD